MREPGSKPHSSALSPTCRDKKPLERGDYFVFADPPHGFNFQHGPIIKHEGVNMQFVAQHKNGAVEFIVLGPSDE